MGSESDRLVFDYLSRVGDLAQQRQMPSGTRMRLVSELRGEIERRRAKATTPDGPAAVRRILARLGSPDEVVTAAGTNREGAGGTPEPEDPAAGALRPTRPAARPADTTGGDGGVPDGDAGRRGDAAAAGEALGRWAEALRPKPPRRRLPRPRAAADAPDTAGQTGAWPASDAPSPPHLASTDELGAAGSQPDWWRTDDGPLGGTEIVPGFVGGVEIPEILRPPAPKEKATGEDGAAAPKDPEGQDGTVVDAGSAAGPRGLRRLLRRRTAAAGTVAAPATKARRSWTNPLLLVAAALLVGGVVLGNWLALALGWVIAYASRRLTTAESKWAVLGLPGLAVAAGAVWLWGRQNGRWGEPVAQGHMSDAIVETWPWVLRGAALASAAFLVWRSQRGRS